MMKKIQIKLISVILLLGLSVSIVVASSYAWMVLSTSPVATGMQVVIAGGNTVLIAPNIRVTMEDGTVCNYPGLFSDKMNFNQQTAYDYLDEIGNLTPVSTVNGIDWILPAYYSGMDSEVQQGRIPSGTIKDISAFTVDSELSHANLSAEDEGSIYQGHYVYVDFWVVSPAKDYKLRVSTGIDAVDGGSFVIDLLEPEATTTGYTLKNPIGSPSAAVRIGFLANGLTQTDGSVELYKSSPYYDSRFTHLKGLYQEPETGTAYLSENRFTIYEPNGDAHPAYPEIDGTYVETKPLALIEGRIMEQRTRFYKNSYLTVQKASTWALADNYITTAIEQRFQTALFAGTWKDIETEKMTELFYGSYLQGQISPYVCKGGFVQSTEVLYNNINSLGSISQELLRNENAGATDDAIIIELERNVPQRIRMFIWLEGQDVDCIESICTSRFAVNIELACGDV